MRRFHKIPLVAALTLGLMTCGMLLSTRIAAQESLQSAQDVEGVRLRRRLQRLRQQIGNIELGLAATGILQHSLNNDGNNPEDEESTDATWSIDFELQAQVARNGVAFMLIEAGQGLGLTNEPGIGSSFFGVNDDASESEAKLDVTEVWYEYRLERSRLTFTIGKIDLTNYFDANEVANDATTQFLSTGLANSIALEFPTDNGPGVRLGVRPLPWLDMRFGWAQAKGEFEDVFNDPFFILEVDVHPLFGELAGHYRVYWWLNSTDHTPFDAAEKTGDNWGIGVSIDQQLLKPVTAFFRWSIQDKDVSAVAMAWSVGLETQGVWWQRPDDVVAIAIGQALLSSKFTDSVMAPVETGDEFFAEGYYRLIFNEQLAFSVHVQVVDNPGGNEAFDTVAVIGGRLQLTF